jgi:hypothetical protein
VADRESKLRLLVEMIGAEKAAAVLEKFPGVLGASEAAAESASAALNQATSSVDKLGAAEQETAAETRAVAAELERAGEQARETGSEIDASARQSADALEEVVAAAREGEAALERAGAAGVEAARETEVATERATASINELIQRWREQEAAARKSGAANVASTREVVSALATLTAELRESGASTEVQRIGISAIVGELEEMTREHVKAGAAGREQADITATALQQVRARLADVNAEAAEEIAILRSLGQQGASAFDMMTGAAFTFEEASEGAARQVNAAWEQVNETYRLTPRQLGLVAQAVEATKIAMLTMSEQGQAATVEQIARYEQLENQLRQLTAVSNRFTNANRDNAVGLQEAGNQIAGVALGVQQLTSALGPNAARLGLVLGNVGQLGSAYEQLKDQIGALNLNTLQLGRANAAAATQIGAVAVAATAGVVAGSKLSAMSAANTQTLDALKKSLKEFKDDVLSGAISRVGAMEDQMQKMAVSIATAAQELERFNVVRAIEALGDLKEDTVALGIAMEEGADGAKAYYNLINAGVESVAAMRTVTDEATDATELFRLSQQLGQNGLALWNAAVANSGGTIAGLARELKVLKIDLEDEARVQGLSAEANKAAAAAKAQHTEESRKLTKEVFAEASAIQAANDAATRTATANLVLQQAVNGSSEAINISIRSMLSMIEHSDRHSVALSNESATISSLLGGLDGLSTAQRRRIADLAELLKRGDELTASERRYAEELGKAILQGNTATVTLNERAAATEALAAAIGRLSNSQMMEAAADEARINKLREQIDLIREMIAEQERAHGVTREQTAINHDQGASLDFLRMREQQLQAELETSLTSWSASAEAKKTDADETQRLIASLSQQKTATDDVTTSARALIAVNENGKIVWTNLTTEQQKNAEATTAVIGGNQKLKVSTDDAVASMRALQGSVPEVNKSLLEMVGIAKDLAPLMGDVAENIRRANEEASRAAAQ